MTDIWVTSLSASTSMGPGSEVCCSQTDWVVDICSAGYIYAMEKSSRDLHVARVLQQPIPLHDG